MDKPFSIDRIEEDIAVLAARDGRIFSVLARFLPPHAREGDLIALQGGKWAVLCNETEKTRKALFDMQENLFDE